MIGKFLAIDLVNANNSSYEKSQSLFNLIIEI